MMNPRKIKEFIEQIPDWKDRWNNGDVKFVPDLFELTDELQKKIIMAETMIAMLLSDDDTQAGVAETMWKREQVKRNDK